MSTFKLNNLIHQAGDFLRLKWSLSPAARVNIHNKAVVPYGNGYMEIHKDHFHPLNVNSRQRTLFSKSVSLVEVEVFSFCNRKCWFCPNSMIDRRHNNVFMDDQLYRKLLLELAEVDYKGKIFYSRYNEPLSNRIILDRIQTARKILPQATLCTFSNGDYLTKKYLEDIYSAGLRELYISLYLGNKAKFNDLRMHRRISHFIKKLGLKGRWTIEKPGIEYHFNVNYKDMKFIVFGRNFDQIGYDRAGTISLDNSNQRQAPCFTPFTAVYIDVNGAVVPCCNIRSDNPEHQKYIAGNLQKSSIFEIYSNSLVSWRRSLIHFGDKQPPCTMCQMHADKIPHTRNCRMLIREIQRKFIKGEHA